MRKVRVIPRLDIKGPNLVKGIHLEGLRVIGNPSEFAHHYYNSGADELIFMDVVASLYERNSLHDIIRETAKDIFIPITVGGGVRSLADIQNILKAGADKVAINTAAIRMPKLIEEASRAFGASTIVATVEAIRQPNGEYLAFVDNGRESTGVKVLEWVRRLEELGAGEIMITSVDREGTGQGYDIELIQSVVLSVDIPVVAHGGVGRKKDVVDLATKVDVSAVAMASIFHYAHVQETFDKAHGESQVATSEGNREFLTSKGSFNKIKGATIFEVKSALKENGVDCRL